MDIKTFLENLEALHKEWQGKLGTHYTRDGVMYHEGETEEQTIEKWLASKIRIAVVLKDQHQFSKNGETWDEDIRYWLKYVKEDNNWKAENAAQWDASVAANRNIKSRFIKIIA